MNKSQWITICVAVLLTAGLFTATYGHVVGDKKISVSAAKPNPGAASQGQATAELSVDTILAHARQHLSSQQATRLEFLEHSISRGDVQQQKIAIYHQLSRFWQDSMQHPDLGAWYLGEAARLENSENSLTFAARKFLELLREEQQQPLKQWEAVQAEALYKRALELNPDNDSTKIGLAATRLYGGSAPPMQSIGAIREVADRDSNNAYAQQTLAEASMMSQQYDKAYDRYQRVARLQPDNLDAIFMSADLAASLEKREEAIQWYSKALPLISKTPGIAPERKAEFKKEVEARIAGLKK